MNFLTYAVSDVGIRKETNQDSLTLKVGSSCHGAMAFAVICDGMGGLAKGELASATVIEAFSRWFYEELPMLIQQPDLAVHIKSRWQEVLKECNELLNEYGQRRGMELGTTITAMLFLGDTYYMINLGDTRAYEIKENAVQMTIDHSFIAREMRLGRMTKEQAEHDPRRNALLQCVGACNTIQPDFYCGKVKENTVYLVCSDGFRHAITPQEMAIWLAPVRLNSQEAIKKNVDYLIDVDKSRREQDNISAIVVRSYQ